MFVIIRYMEQPIRILLPVDGSAFTQRALDFLLGHLSWWRAMPQVDLLHVEPPVGTALARAYLSREVLDSYYNEQSEAVLTPVRSALQASGVPVAAHQLVGEPAKRIVEFALERKSNLIIMGSHGHTALGNVALGSVATKLLATCHIPVLIVR